MPQESLVLRCYSCRRFQVHLVKKAKKWQCKLCNSKQSLKQIFGKGSGKYCRIHAMRLNERQFMGEEKINDEIFHFEVVENNEKDDNSLRETKNFKSKWLNFIDVQKLTVSSKEENEERNSLSQRHYIGTRSEEASGENNNAFVGHINDSYKSYNTSAGNLEVVNKLDCYFKENSLCKKDLNRIEIKEIQDSSSNINKYSKYTSADDNESKLYKPNSVFYEKHEKQSKKKIRIFEDSVAEEELDEILRF